MAKVATCACFPDCGAHEKPCIECGRELPLTEFYQHAMMGDGHLNKCKECVRAYQRIRHREKIEDPEWREAERARARDKYHRLYAPSDPLVLVSPEAPEDVKRHARVHLGNAVRDGRLDKPDACGQCGALGRIHGHHDDYSKPLDVRWLCAACHHAEHRVKISELQEA